MKVIFNTAQGLDAVFSLDEKGKIIMEKGDKDLLIYHNIISWGIQLLPDEVKLANSIGQRHGTTLLPSPHVYYMKDGKQFLIALYVAYMNGSRYKTVLQD